MPAPQQVGAARTASTTPVFWVSTGEPTTAFSRATNGFLATRTPLATAELNRKIAMMAPQDKDKAILDLLTAESEHVKNMAAAGKDYRQQMNDALKYATDVERQAIQGQATTRAASVQARGRLRGQELGRDVNLRQMEELKPEDSSYADTLKQQLVEKYGPGAAEGTATSAAEIQDLLVDAFGGVDSEGNTVPGKLASASPAAKQRLSQELHAIAPGDDAFGQMIDEHIGPGDINAPEDMLGGDVAGDIGDGRDVTARNLGARDPQVGEAGKFALEQARRMAANEPTATSSTQGDAVMGQFGEQLASLRAQNGRSRRVDFNAPLIRDEEYAKPWDQIEQSLASPGGSGTEFGAQLATSLKSAAQRGRAHGGMTEADLMAGADQRRSFQGPITTPEGPVRAARIGEGNDAAAMAQGPSQGSGGAGRGAGAPVGGARKPPAWQGPRQLPNMGRQGGLTPEQYAEVDRIIAARKRVSDSVPGILTAGAFGAAHGGQNPDRFAEHGAARARAAVAGEDNAAFRQAKTDEALRGIDALENPTPSFAAAHRPPPQPPADVVPSGGRMKPLEYAMSDADTDRMIRGNIEGTLDYVRSARQQKADESTRGIQNLGEDWVNPRGAVTVGPEREDYVPREMDWPQEGAVWDKAIRRGIDKVMPQEIPSGGRMDVSGVPTLASYEDGTRNAQESAVWDKAIRRDIDRNMPQTVTPGGPTVIGRTPPLDPMDPEMVYSQGPAISRNIDPREKGFSTPPLAPYRPADIEKVAQAPDGPDPRTLDIIARVKARRAGQGAR